MRVVLFVNPAARRVTGEATAVTRARWSDRHDVRLVLSRPATLAEDLRAELDGADAVVVLSGDGTVNQVANVLCEARSDATLVPLPGGTTNVLARGLGLSRSLPEATEAAMAALEAGATRRRGLGRLNGRGFLLNAGVGFDAAIVERVEADPARKRRFGHLWFAVAATGALVGDARRTRLRVVRPTGGPPADAFWTVALASCPYSFAGRRRLDLLAPGCGCDGGLTVLTLAPLHLPRAMSIAARVLFTSCGITRAPGVDLYELRDATSSITVSAAAPVPAQADGEPLGRTSAHTLTWEPDALRVLAPVVPASLQPCRRTDSR